MLYFFLQTLQSFVQCELVYLIMERESKRLKRENDDDASRPGPSSNCETSGQKFKDKNEVVPSPSVNNSQEEDNVNCIQSSVEQKVGGIFLVRF